jgi:anti-anti-sigma factor
VRSGEAVIVDLSEVEFIDSSVLTTLITIDRMAHERGSTLTLLLNTAPIVRRLVEISGLTDHLSCVGSREEAIQAARRSRPPSGGSAR